MEFLDFAHILWEAIKPTTILTDNKSVTRFFKTKANPPELSGMHVNICCNLTSKSTQCWFSQHCSRKPHQTGTQNHGEDTRKIREDIQTTPIEMTTSSSDVALEGQFFFTQADKSDKSEEQTLEQKEQPIQKA